MYTLHSCKNLKLIVTTKPGKEEVVENQVGDSLYIEDINITIKRTKYSGVLLVYTSLSPWRAFWLVNTYPIHGASRIIVVECCTERELSKLLQCIKSLLMKHVNDKGIGLEITIRGHLYNKKVIEANIFKLLKETEFELTFKGIEYELKIEVIDNIITASIMPWRSDRVSRRIKEIIRRLGISNEVIDGV